MCGNTCHVARPDLSACAGPSNEAVVWALSGETIDMDVLDVGQLK